MFRHEWGCMHMPDVQFPQILWYIYIIIIIILMWCTMSCTYQTNGDYILDTTLMHASIIIKKERCKLRTWGLRINPIN
jgi:hypothetical protein